MKLALGLSVCCFLLIAGTVVLAPEYAHKIIDRIHGNLEHTTNPSRTESEKEGTSDTPLYTTPATTISVEKPVLTTTPIYTTPIEHPRTKKEMLEWLRTNGYSVETRQWNYLISWQMFKRTNSKPSGSVNIDGKVVDYHRGKISMSVGVGNSSINGNNVNQTISISDTSITVTNNGITTTFSIKHQNGWGIETKRSFYWNLDRDHIKDVWLKAKKIKDELKRLSSSINLR